MGYNNYDAHAHILITLFSFETLDLDHDSYIYDVSISEKVCIILNERENGRHYPDLTIFFNIVHFSIKLNIVYIKVLTLLMYSLLIVGYYHIM